MNMKNLEGYLKQLGEQEKNIRKVLSDPSSTVAQRTSALKLLNDIQIFLRGFFSSLRLVMDEASSKKYKEYYDQARSERGLKL